MHSTFEGRLRHTNDRNAVLGVHMGAQAGPTIGIEVNVTVDHDHCELPGWRDDRPQRR